MQSYLEHKDRAIALASTVVHGAAKAAKAAELRELLTQYPDFINSQIPFNDSVFTTLLYCAARANNLTAVRVLLEKGADPNVQTKGSGDNTPMHVACYHGFVDIVQAIMENGNTNPAVAYRAMTNSNGDTCVSLFSEAVTPEVSRVIRQMVTIPMKDLVTAIKDDRLDRLEAFAEALGVDFVVSLPLSGDPDDKGVSLSTVLLFAVRFARSVKPVDFLLGRGADSNGVVLKNSAVPRVLQEQKLYRTAIMTNQWDKFEESSSTLETEPSIKAKEEEQQVPMQNDWRPLYAAYKRWYQAKVDEDKKLAKEVGKLLIRFGADVSLLSRGSRPFQQFSSEIIEKVKLASWERAQSRIRGVEGTDDSDLQAFLDNPGDGFSIDHNFLDPDCTEASNNKTISMLSLAIRCKCIDAVKRLLDKGANGGQTSGDKLTSLMIACDTDYVVGVETLIANFHSCNILVTDGNGKTACDGHIATCCLRIQQLVREATRRAIEEQKEKNFQEYVRTLPQRNEQHLVVELPMQPSREAVVAAIISVLQTIMDSLINHAKAEGANPVACELRVFARNSALSVANREWTVEKLMAVPSPRLFPVTAEELFNQQVPLVAPALATRIRSLVHHSVSIDLSPLNSKPRDAKDALSGCQEVCDDVKRACEAAVRNEITSNSNLGRLGTSFYSNYVLDKAVQVFVGSKTLSPPEGIMAACSTPPFIDNIPCSHEMFTEFLTQLGWGKIPYLKPLLERLVGELSSMSSTTAVGAKIQVANSIIVDFLTMISSSWITTVHKSLGEPAIGDFVTRYVDRIVAKWNESLTENYLKQKGKALEKNWIVDRELFPTKENAERRFCDLPAFREVLQTTIDEAKEGDFKAQMLTLMKKSTPAPTQPREMLDEYLRLASLHYRWKYAAVYKYLTPLLEFLRDPSRNVLLLQSQPRSGKSPMLPQFFAGYGFNVYQTYWRRLPLRELAQSVGQMFSTSNVGYDIGGSNGAVNSVISSAKGPSIQFRSDEVMLSEILQWKSLPANTVLIIDEAHERMPRMELITLLILHRLASSPQSTFKLVLSGAVVSADVFHQTVKKFSLPPLAYIRVDVPSKFTITEESLGETPKGRDVAAVDVLKPILRKEKDARVLVYFPQPTDLISAQRRAKQDLPSTKIVILEAHATDNLAKIMKGQVFFADTALETTLTIPNLSYVIDFNLSLVATYRSDRNLMEYAVQRCTAVSKDFRRSRLGTHRDGTLKQFFPGEAAVYPAGLEAFTNDELAAAETMVRGTQRSSKGHFLTLFAEGDACNVLGLGLRPRVEVTALLPQPDDIPTLALLGLPGGMAQCFVYALKKNTVPLAILWLAALCSSSDPLTVAPTAPIANTKNFAKFGVHGDHGVLLDLYAMFLKESPAMLPAESPTGSKYASFCKDYLVNPVFLENAHARIQSYVDTCARKLPVPLKVADWKQYDAWKWDEIEDALLAGYWRSVCWQPSCPLHSGVSEVEFKGPYHHFDSHQTTQIDVSTLSVWREAERVRPKYAVYQILQRPREDSIVHMVTASSVSASAVKKWCGNSSQPKVHQYISLTEPKFRKLKEKHALLAPPTGCAATIVVQTDRTKFSTSISQRVGSANGILDTIAVEIEVAGTMIDVATAMDDLAKKINEALTS